MPRCYRWRKQSENFLFLGRWRAAATTHKDTHKLQTFDAISSRNLARSRRGLDRQKSFIQRSFGTMRHPRTYWGRLRRKAASLGLEPRQRDPESLVLPLHHEAKARGTRSKAQFARCASRSKTDPVAINPRSFPHLRARLRPQGNFRF